MAWVVGLGHVGIYVRDLEKMGEFYRDFLGMQITKVSKRAFIPEPWPSLHDQGPRRDAPASALFRPAA